jgi:hypothetical protein
MLKRQNVIPFYQINTQTPLPFIFIVCYMSYLINKYQNLSCSFRKVYIYRIKKSIKTYMIGIIEIATNNDDDIFKN